MSHTQSLQLYNSLTRIKEPFCPIDADKIRMYVCGPTVYDRAHIGNARPVVVFDVLFRLLRYLYGPEHIIYVRNITDVDDKINARALQDYPDCDPNVAIQNLTEKTYAGFQDDVCALGNLTPSIQPKATQHIQAMRALIERLVEKGVAYVADNHVFFSPSAMNSYPHVPDYGHLARRCLEDMLLGTRIEALSSKRAQEDFVLWKPSQAYEPSWPSPVGILVEGRPGWHIECSAMAMTHLLEPFGGGLLSQDPMKNIFDIHGGGADLMFPHHENEIAQSCCAFSSPRMANIWMHNGFVQIEGKKMAKSEGNFITIHDLLATQKFGGCSWSGDVLRLALLKTHYRDPIDFTVKKLQEASSNLLFWKRVAQQNDCVSEIPPDEEFLGYLKDDLNLSAAFARLNALAKETQKNQEKSKSFLASAHLIGLLLPECNQIKQKKAKIDEALIHQKIKERKIFVEQRNWKEADRIRDELLLQGVRLKDKKDPKTGVRTVTWESESLNS